MEPVAIIESFNKRKDLPTRLLPRVIRLVMNEFILQGAEETLRHGVVVTVPLPAHTRCDAESDEVLLIGNTTVLSPLIRVMDQSGTDTPLTDRHRQCGKRQLLIRLLPHRPADDPSGTEIQQHRHIEPARAGRDHGDIPDPDAVEPRGHKPLLQQIGRRRGELMMLHDHPWN